MSDPHALPEVSVVIPTHNRAALLERALQTALGQQEVEVEVIVVDDGSSDGTACRLASHDDRRVRFIRHEVSKGQANARNAGVALARGSWIAFLDDDDVWAPTKLRKQLDAAIASGAGAAIAAALHVDEDGRVFDIQRPVPAVDLASALGSSNAVPAGASNVLVRADTMAAAGGWDSQFDHFTDWDLWLRLVRLAPIATLEEPLVGYVHHPASKHVRQPGAALAELETLDRKHYGKPFDAERTRRYIYTWIVNSYGAARKPFSAVLVAARLGFAHRDPKGGVKLAIGALRAYALGSRSIRQPREEARFPRPDWLEAYWPAASVAPHRSSLHRGSASSLKLVARRLLGRIAGGRGS